MIPLPCDVSTITLFASKIRPFVMEMVPSDNVVDLVLPTTSSSQLGVLVPIPIYSCVKPSVPQYNELLFLNMYPILLFGGFAFKASWIAVL